MFTKCNNRTFAEEIHVQLASPELFWENGGESHEFPLTKWICSHRMSCQMFHHQRTPEMRLWPSKLAKPQAIEAMTQSMGPFKLPQYDQVAQGLGSFPSMPKVKIPSLLQRFLMLHVPWWYQNISKSQNVIKHGICDEYIHATGNNMIHWVVTF